MKKRSSIIKNILISTGFLAHCFLINFFIFCCFLAYGISGKGREHGYIPFIVYGLIAAIINVAPLLIMSNKRFIPKASIVTALITNVLASSLNFSIHMYAYNFDFSNNFNVFFFIANLLTYIITVSFSIISAVIKNKT